MEELDPKQTSRAAAFELWMKAPMPMVTLFKTLDAARLARLSRRGLKFNMLLCWCAGKAASRVEEFYTLPVGDKLIRYGNLAVNTVVALRDGDIATCDVPFSESLDQFQRDYLALTAQVRESGKPYDLNGDYMVIGTSALPQTEIDGAVNIYAGFYNNPFLVWGKVRKKLWRASLPVSFQFHHTQMDGGHAARFLENLQNEIRALNPRPCRGGPSGPPGSMETPAGSEKRAAEGGGPYAVHPGCKMCDRAFPLRKRRLRFSGKRIYWKQ